jgi:hypothetical protein
MGHFTLNGRIVAEVKISRFQGQVGLGLYRLLVHLDFVFMRMPEGEGAILHELTGDLQIEGCYASSLRLFQGLGQFSIGEYEGSLPVLLVADLSLRQLQAIEDLRQGKGLTIGVNISMTCWGKLHGGTGLLRASSGYLSHQVTQGAWIEVLNELGYRKIMLLEIPEMAESLAPELMEAVAYLAKAQQALHRGEYREAVGCCRDVLESLSTAMGDSDVQDTEFQAFFKDVRSKDKAARLRLVRRAMKILSHPARHADEVATQIEWSRTDATAVITMIAALLQQLGSKKV